MSLVSPPSSNGWTIPLRSKRRAGLHQEKQLTSRKRGRCHVIKENEAKRRIPWCGGGGYKMATQTILPPPQAADSGPKVAYLWQICKYACNGMFQSRWWTICGSHVIMSGFGQNIHFSANSANSAKNLFYKIDAEASYLPYSSVKICLSLSCQLGNQIHTLYSKHELLWGLRN